MKGKAPFSPFTAPSFSNWTKVSYLKLGLLLRYNRDRVALAPLANLRNFNEELINIGQFGLLAIYCLREKWMSKCIFEFVTADKFEDTFRHSWRFSQPMTYCSCSYKINCTFPSKTKDQCLFCEMHGTLKLTLRWMAMYTFRGGYSCKVLCPISLEASQGNSFLFQ